MTDENEKPKPDFNTDAPGALPEGFDKSTLAVGQVERCPVQVPAVTTVRGRMQTMVKRLDEKRIFTIFATTLYAIACDKHGGDHKMHVDLCTTSIAELQPAGVIEAIRATEALLEQLKKRAS